jgi:acetyl-CoA carboxylase biotin carboxylase subunit
MSTRPFTRLLIANRGEIALRIQRACRTLGIETVAVHSIADAQSRHVREADQALCIGPAAPAKSYLDGDAILLAAQVTGAGAIHPGYGFLSENAAFAEAVEQAGLTFGARRRRDPHHGRQDRRQARHDRGGRALRARIGWPPAVGYGYSARPPPPSAIRSSSRHRAGRRARMRVIHDPAQLAEAVMVTAREAQQAFGNPTLYLEKFLQKPRHIEIQVLCDTHGTALWLGARDCSLQRRHQKIIEEAPPPASIPRRSPPWESDAWRPAGPSAIAALALLNSSMRMAPLPSSR